MKKLRNEELNRLTIDEFRQAEKKPVIIILDNIRSLHNIGSIFRTGDAFRVAHIYLCGITACPPHREIHKTALGSTETVDWTYFEKTTEAIELARKEGYSVIALEQTDESIYLNEYQPVDLKKLALVLGNEIKGVSEDVIPLVDGCLEIPQFGHKHSFNVSVSSGIALWDLLQKMKLL
ncbi:MAG: RNA methyltransferase [bacterium]